MRKYVINSEVLAVMLDYQTEDILTQTMVQGMATERRESGLACKSHDFNSVPHH